MRETLRRFWEKIKPLVDQGLVITIRDAMELTGESYPMAQRKLKWLADAGLLVRVRRGFKVYYMKPSIYYETKRRLLVERLLAEKGSAATATGPSAK